MSYYAEGDSPIVAGGSGNCGNSGFGWGNDAWVLIILFALIFGWGRDGNHGNSGYSTPTILATGALGADAALQRGFDTSEIIGKLDGINYGLCNGFYAMNTSMLNGFAGVNNSLCQGFSGVNNAIATNGYETRNAISQLDYHTQSGINSLASHMASCCCDLKSGQKDIAYQMATNTCAINTNVSNVARDIIDSQRASTDAILGFLTNEKISSLQADKAALTAQLSQNAQTRTLIDALRPTPVPAFCIPTPYYYGTGVATGCGACGASIQ